MQAQKGDAAETGGNQWHDNFSFEQLVREEDSLIGQIEQLSQKIEKAVVVREPPLDTQTLQIGHIAVLDIDGEEKRVKVGGFEDSNLSVDPPIVSYTAPLIAQLIGEEVETCVSVQIRGKIQEIILGSIFQDFDSPRED